MKQKSENDSKAGIQQKNTKVLKNLFSKSASMLLIAMAGFGMMSFTQDDEVLQGDTNLNLAKQTAAVAVNINEACCAVQASKPGDDVKKSLIRVIASPKTILNADVENFNAFIAEEQERRMWSMNLATARKNADNEINFNFQLSRLYPEATAQSIADAQMETLFEEEVIKAASFNARGYQVKADVEMERHFLTEHFSIKLASATQPADQEMAAAFEKANQLLISVPSRLVAAQADAEVKKNYEAAVKALSTVAVK